MATIAELLIKLGMDDGGLDKGMSSSQSKLKSWGKQLKDTGDYLTTRVTLPILAAGAAAINWASQLDQAQGKADAVFGDSADAVKDWSKTTAHAYGFAQSESLAMASTYGALFKVIGQTNEVAADQSMALVGLAADMAAFNDVSNSRASEALMAGLTGEYTSLKSMGIFLNEATVNTEALAIAQAEGREEITESDKVQARYNIIMKQTAQQQGQAAREAKNFASQMERVRAKIKDMGAAIGNILMPYVLDFLERIQVLIDKFMELDPKWQKAIIAVAAFAAALGPVLILIGMMLPALGVLGTVIGLLVSPIGLVVVALAALIGLGIYAFINDLWGVRDAVYAVLDALSVFKPVLTDIVDIFQAAREGNWVEVFDELKDALISLGQALFELQGIVVEALAGLLARFIDWAQGYDWRGLLMTVGQALFDGLMAGIEWAWPIFRDWLTDLPNKVMTALSAGGDWALTLLQKGSDLVAGLLQGASEKWPEVQTWLGTLPGLLLAAIEAAGDFAVMLLQKGRDLLQGVLDGLAEKLPVVVAWLALLGTVAFAAVGDVAKSLLQKGLDLIQGVIDGFNDRWETAQAWLAMVGTLAFAAVGDVAQTLYDKGMDLIEGAFNGILDNWDSVRIWLEGIAGRALSAVGNLAGTLYQSGMDLIQGLINGIQSKIPFLESAVSLVSNLLASIDKSGSPWPMFVESGRFLVEGLEVGIEKRLPYLEDTIAGLNSTIDGAAQAGAYGVGVGAAQPIVNNYYALSAADLMRVLEDSEMGASFARGFGQQAGLYAGMP